VTPVASPEGTVNPEYYPDTGRLLRTYTAANETVYAYDVLGRLTHAYATRFGGTTHATYAGFHPTTGLPQFTGDLVTFLNNVLADYVYDALNRLDLLTHYLSDANNADLSDNPKLVSYDYALLPGGRRDKVTETDTSGGGVLRTTTIDWAYDDLGRLTEELYLVNGLTIDDAWDFRATYAYDLTGNRLRKLLDSGDNGKDETIAYRYDAQDHLLIDASTLGTAPNVTTTTTTYLYDANGSTTQKLVNGTPPRSTGGTCPTPWPGIEMGIVAGARLRVVIVPRPRAPKCSASRRESGQLLLHGADDVVERGPPLGEDRVHSQGARPVQQRAVGDPRVDDDGQGLELEV
jgi:hypothetical protein